MNLKLTPPKAVLAILFILALSWHAKAGVEPVLRNSMSGASVRTDSFRVVEDPQYAASNLSAYNLYKVNNYVSLEINQDQIATCFLDSFYFTAEVEVLGWDEFGTQHADTAHLTVYYNQLVGKEYSGIHTLKLQDYYKLQIRIISVSNTSLTDYIRVSAEIAIERYQDLDVGTTPSISSSSYNATTGDISVSWAAIDGAEEYDLEYTFVDDYDGASGYLSASSLEVFFKNNATRVSVQENTYSFSNVFEHGYVVFRVRAAGYTGASFTHRIQGPWSDQSNTSSLSDYSGSQKLAVTELNPTLNWQYVNTFSEWGKRKELISFMDGSFRSRQSITRISSDTTLIVGEAIYDYQGREAVQILPVPIDAQKIEYQADFNLEAASHSNYNRIHFDTGSCGLTALALDDDAGAAKYYSANNEFLTKTDHWLADHNPYIPKANGYAFTRTIYTPDNSGRIAIQSGVGQDHKIGSGHETRYFYATPFQEELDRLFGNNVGYSVHYQKQMTVDPNGQVSVSYTDLSGKVIATALGGASPENTNELSNNDGEKELEVQILSTEHSAADPYSLTVAKTINVAVASEYRLSYVLSLASFSDECMSECAECVYDLKLSVKDECGTELLDGDNYTGGIQEFVRQIKRVDSSYFSTSCPDGEVYYKFIDDEALNDSIRVSLDIGSYIITKSLSVSQQAAEFYADKYLEDSSCVRTIGEFNTYFTGIIDDFGCDITCEACTEMLADSSAYKASRKSAYLNLGYEDDAELDILVSEEYQAKKAICDQVCDGAFSPCEGKRLILETDVAPGGQYQSFEGDITLHPEYCVLEFCENNPTAFNFEKQINNEIGGDISILNGWMNPLKGNGQFPIGEYDTFFYANAGFKENLEARLANVATLDISGSHELNIWQTVIYATYCKDSSTWGDISSCIDNFDYNSNNCAPRSAYAFDLFRAIYLKNRKDAMDSIMNANECTGMSIPEGKEARFWTNDQIEDLKPVSEAAMNDSLELHCFEACDSMSYGWLQVLGECVLNHPSVENIRLDLVSVCQRGCDGNNPLGASSVAPANISGSLPNSFQEVLEDYGIYDIATCNPSMISFMDEYQDLAADTASAVGETDDCNCASSSGADSCLLKLNDPTLVAVMKRMTITEDTSCTNCLTCEEFYPYYLGFDTIYGEVLFDTDTVQINWSIIFTNYLNDTLDFDLTYYDYVDFIEGCTQTADSGFYFETVLSKYKEQYQWVDGLQMALHYDPIIDQEEYKLAKRRKALSQNLLVDNSSVQATADIDYANPYNLYSYLDHNYELLAPNKIANLPSPTGVLIDRCVCASLLATDNELSQAPYPAGAENVFSYWDSIYDGCNIADIEVIDALKDICRQAYQTHVSTDLTNSVLACTWNDNAENATKDLTLSYAEISGDWQLYYKFPEVGQQSCIRRNCSGCETDTSDLDDPGDDGDIPIDVLPYPCQYLTRSIDSIMMENAWTSLEPNDTTWWLIAQRIDGNNAEEPYYRLGGFQDSAFRMKRIKAEISRCIVNDPCLIKDYFQPCEGTVDTGTGTTIQPVTTKSPKRWLVNNFLDELAGPRDSNLYNWIAIDNWLFSESNVGLSTFKETQLYTGAYPYALSYDRTVDSNIGTAGQPFLVEIGDGNGFTLELELGFQSWSGGNVYSNIQNFIGVEPVMDSPCDTEAYLFNLLAVLNSPGGYDTVWMYGQTNMYNLLETNQAPLLCNKRRTLVENKCALNLGAMALAMANDAYDRYTDSVRENFIHRYKTHCIEQARLGEDFKMRFNQQEYHYTLYHYDLAGNLLQTVPPAGVNYLNSGQLTLVENFREGTGAGYYPYHDLPTYYQYNTLNELKWQATPDGGVSDFWYDKLGRLIVSRNAKQKAYTNQAYSYTLYDDLGRITEVGEVDQALLIDSMTFATAFNASFFSSWLAGGNKSQVTRTYYDWENFSVNYNGFDQHYLRNRVASTTFSPAGSEASYTHAVHYDYDVHGNVQSMVREMVGLDSINQRYKIINYDYELVSGNVNMVSYQADSIDRFFHKYAYDSDNRITSAYTSRDKVHWDRDANYTYYLHGPMARTELGELRVQGMDYAYTIHGWLKGVNSERLRTNHDIGEDGNNGSNNQWVCRDVFGFGLGYYNTSTEKDYESISTISAATNFIINKDYSDLQGSNTSLFNGNISHMVTAIGEFMEQGDVPFGRVFTYDQLNRLKSSRAYNNIDTTYNEWNSGGSALTQYATDYTYDANGNILTLLRKGKAATPNMDNLSYHYYANTNRLEYVDDAVSSSNYGIDIDDQSAGNYTYDEIGNLISDASEEIEEIQWTVYGKIAAIIRTSASTKPNLQFEYSPDGHRVAKHVIEKSGLTKSTWYVRDASGNIMATYSKDIYMDLDTTNIFADSLIMMIKNTETTETYIDFMIEGLNMAQYLTTTKYEDLRDYLNSNSLLETTLESVSPMVVLSSNPSWASTVMDNISAAKLNAALLMQYGYDEVMYANTVYGSSCYYTFLTDILTTDYFPFAENILLMSDPTDVQNLWDSHFFPTPFPGHSQAALDLYNNVSPAVLHLELENLNPGMIFQLYQNSAGYGALTTYLESWPSMIACARASLSDEICLDAVDLSDRPYLWSLVQSLYIPITIADEMITYNPDIFLRAGLLQAPDMALTLLESGTYFLIPPSLMYPNYLFSVTDVFNAIENYLPFGSLYLQNMKNNLMNGGHTAPGWVYNVAEHHIYGSSRVGVHQTNLTIASRFNNDPVEYTVEESEYVTFTRGKRNYELSNHLGNVQVVITDKRVSKCDSELAIEYFQAEVLTAMDYYPFGMMMPDRQYYANSDSSIYRFGFNGQEKDNEVSGVGNSYTAEFWQYDSRLGRRFNLDPKGSESVSFYATFNNNPIRLSDPYGDTVYVVGGLALNKLKGMVSEENRDKISLVTIANPEDANYNRLLAIDKAGYTPGTDAGMDLLIAAVESEKTGLFEINNAPEGRSRSKPGNNLPTPYLTQQAWPGVQVKTGNRKTGINNDDSGDPAGFPTNYYLPIARVSLAPETASVPFITNPFDYQISIHSTTKFYHKESGKSPELPFSLGAFVTFQTTWLVVNDNSVVEKNLNDHYQAARKIVLDGKYKGKQHRTLENPAPSSSNFTPTPQN